MKYRLLSFLSFMLPALTFAQESTSEKIDAVFSKYTSWFVDAIFYEIPFSEQFQIPWVLIVLVGGALYFTIYFKLINFTGFWTAIKVVQGKYEDIEKHGVDHLYGDSADEHDQPDTIRDDAAHGDFHSFQDSVVCDGGRLAADCTRAQHQFSLTC